MAAGRDYELVELCIAACADDFADKGEVLASGTGVVPRLAAGLARLTTNPDLLLTDGECMLVAEPVPLGPRGNYQPTVESWLPFRKIFDLVWGGRRHFVTTPTQIDRYGSINISCIGDWARPKAMLLGVRGVPGNTINHSAGFFVAAHSPRVFVEKVDMASGAGYDPARWAPGVRRDFHRLTRCVTNLAVLDFGGPGQTLRIVSLHPGVSAEQVQKATGFPLALAEPLRETRAPTREELRLIREVLDPHGQRAGVLGS
jgi:glutaconate CoA-transferase subunit B